VIGICYRGILVIVLNFTINIYIYWNNAKRKTHVTLCVSPKLMWLLKLPLDQNPIVIYHKYNGDFKSHIIFGGDTRGHGDDIYHYSNVLR
jgi:hypothetical protein